MSINTNQKKTYRKIIILLSVVIPIAVAVLFKIKIPNVDLSFLPPFLVMEQLYVGIIMSSKSTNPIIYINICRFLVLIMTLGTGILIFKNFESYGAIVGGSAWSLTLFFEAIFAWLFARKIAKP